MVENHKEPDALPELSKSFTVQKFLDQLPTYLREIKVFYGTIKT